MNPEAIKAFTKSAFFKIAIVGGFLYAVDQVVGFCREFPRAFKRQMEAQEADQKRARGKRKGKRKGAKPGPKAQSAWHNRKRADAPAQ
jgi:hypothetical protein